MPCIIMQHISYYRIIVTFALHPLVHAQGLGYNTWSLHGVHALRLITSHVQLQTT